VCREGRILPCVAGEKEEWGDGYGDGDGASAQSWTLERGVHQTRVAQAGPPF
jgi:hypothetical protein